MPVPAEPDATPPLGLTVGDRVHLEKRIDRYADAFAADKEATLEFRREMRASVTSNRMLVMFALGMATASLVVQLVRLVLVGFGHPPS